jgi:hypothetical protein
VPTICKVLPLYKTIQKHLEVAILDPDLENDKAYGLKGALEAGLAKIDLHLGKALVGDYPLLGAGTWSQLVGDSILSFEQFYTLPSVLHTFKTSQNGTRQSLHVLVHFWNIFMKFTTLKTFLPRLPQPPNPTWPQAPYFSMPSVLALQPLSNS